MSEYSTLLMQRKKAKPYIINKVMNCNDDRLLSNIIDIFLEENLYNCLIVPDDIKDDF